MDIQSGDTVRMRACTVRRYLGGGPVNWVQGTFKAGKGREFVFLLMGVVEEGEHFDANKMLEEMGWKFTGEVK